MKAYLPLAAFLTLCVTIVSGVSGPLSKYCEACLRKSATSGLYAHPTRCDAFVHCDVLEKSFRAYVQMCPPGLFFDEKIRTCNWESAVECHKGCKNRPAIKDVFTCNGYYQCKNGQRSSTLMHCPNLHSFSELQSKCIPDPKCPPPKQPLNCAATFRLHPSDPNKFLQASGNGWIEQRCAIGTGFNMTTCTCSRKIPVIHQNVCELVNLPMVQDLVEKSHNWFINYKDVRIQNGAAKFTNGYVIVPVVTNNDFYDKMSISLSFLLENTPQNKVAVLGNSECAFNPTFSIYLENAHTNSPKMVGAFIIEHKGQNVTVRIETNISHNTWINVQLIKNGDKVRMLVNGNIVGQQIAPGLIKKQDCALTLGQSNGMGNFAGLIRNVRISKCPPP